MIKAFNKITSLDARLCTLHNLAFLLIALLCSCAGKQETDISISWQNDKAIAIKIPNHLLTGPEDSLSALLKVSLASDSSFTSILGDLTLGDEIIFAPLIPFSRGSAYSVFFRNKKIGQFSVPGADKNKHTELMHCYPEQDTLPENLLKIYLAFSAPMREGQSDKYITVIKNETDTLPDVFLKLEQELWNEDRTVLTVWLDPGRIKRDLQPNLRLGAPLQKGNKYQLVVSHQWKDAQGSSIQKDYTKYFIVGQRDSISPQPANWKFELPGEHSLKPLYIISDEPLDHFLLMETLQIKDQRGAVVNGVFESHDKDRSCSFVPSTDWVAGNYSLNVESRLEDLAGNNLNRPFERDITQTKSTAPKAVYVVNFKIE